MSSVQAVCAGVITIDTIALVDRYPSEDERVLANEISRAGEIGRASCRERVWTVV